MLQAVFYIRQSICEYAAGKHGAEHPALGINLVLLEPAEIEHSVMGVPRALSVEELFEHNPFVVIESEAVNHHGRFAVGGQLEQPHASKLGLQLGRLNVKANLFGTCEGRQVRNTKEVVQAWWGNARLLYHS